LCARAGGSPTASELDNFAGVPHLTRNHPGRRLPLVPHGLATDGDDLPLNLGEIILNLGEIIAAVTTFADSLLQGTPAPYLEPSGSARNAARTST